MAAKGGLKGKNYGYPGSTDPDEVAWHYKNSEGTLHRVGLKKKNELGLYEMAGNVAEWCGDWYREWSESNPPEKLSTNPKGPSSGTEKVVKGGDIDADKFEYQANSCRISSRNHLPPSSQIPAEYSEGRLYDFVGFRLVLSDAK